MWMLLLKRNLDDSGTLLFAHAFPNLSISTLVLNQHKALTSHFHHLQHSLHHGPVPTSSRR